MATLLAYRCPQSGQMTQTWLSVEPVAGDRETYQAVTCLACAKQHFICVASGHVLGEDEGRPSSGRAPELLPNQIRRLHDRANASDLPERIKGEAGGAVLGLTNLPKAS
uniref:Uncharacterized protein n=1 Tax=Rhodopseudomonas palustris (strain BisA53) TaxID=316055 RepID=Q07QK1_RHOP5